ncbi:MAG: phospholipid carrier-dependent glycosyltransferase, partial [Planctomycetes bacterium]|nr:phospholipid carrier-dependent glycosyltransferase [Planctomycetota bacterium]
MTDTRAGTAQGRHAPDMTRRSSPNVHWALAAMITLSLAVDLFFFTGFYASDDQQYLRGALSILDGHFQARGPKHGEMRLTITGWNALVMLLVGPARVQLVAASYVVFHQLLNLVTFALGARLFHPKVGLLAAYVSATIPLLVTFSTMILPDIQMTLWIVLSFLAFHEAYAFRERHRRALGGFVLVLAGVCAGLAYATKESGLIVLPFFFGLWLALEHRHAKRNGQRIRRLSALRYGTLFAVGFALVFLAETAALNALSDRAIVRLGWTVQELAPERVERIERVAGLNPLERLERTHTVLGSETFLPTPLRGLLLFGLIAYPFLRGRPWSLYLLP